MSDSQAQSFYATGPDDLAPVVLGALERAGRPTDPIDPDDLAALDEFHGLGRAATVALARLAEVAPGVRLLDVGAGIGGPARTLARHFGAAVTALDPTERFCALNEELTRRAGLAEAIEVVRGDGRRLPFEDASFEVAITQAVWPSVEAKAAMLSEIHRVLAPGGRLAIFEAVAGPSGGELTYPMPWADGPAESFVVSAGEARRLAEAAGFELGEWMQGGDALGPIGELAGSGAPELSAGVEGVDLALVMPEFEARMAGLADNVIAGRIELALALFRRR